MTIVGDTAGAEVIAVSSSESGEPGDRWRRRATPIIVALLLTQMALAMLLGAARDAPVYDETAHITAGILNVREHDLRWNAEHPPLVKVLAGLATLGAKVRIPTDTVAYRAGDEWGVARALLYERGNDPNHLIWLARLPFIVLTLLFGLVVFLFARDLFARTGGLIALTLYSFSPTVLAHGRLVHTDIALAGFLLTTAWCLWRSETRGNAWFAAACVAFGLAMLTKFTALFALPPVLVMAFWTGYLPGGGSRRQAFRRGALRATVILAAAVAIVWIGYLAVSPTLRFETHYYDVWIQRDRGVASSVIDALPLPAAYRVGLRFAAAYDRLSLHPAYLFGKAYSGGNPFFYPAVVAVKTPLGSLAIWTAGLWLLFRRRRPGYLRALLPIPATLLTLSITANTNIGIRHVAVVPVFAAVVAAAVAPYFRNRKALLATGLLLGFVALSVWRAFPYHLAYANEAFGGQSGSYRYLADSNVDWGQDLRRLGEHIARHPQDTPDWIMYFGTASPAAYGIRARGAADAPRGSVHGTVAVSVSLLKLFPKTYGWIAEGREPIARIGPSIMIYRIP